MDEKRVGNKRKHERKNIKSLRSNVTVIQLIKINMFQKTKQVLKKQRKLQI